MKGNCGGKESRRDVCDTEFQISHQTISTSWLRVRNLTRARFSDVGIVTKRNEDLNRSLNRIRSLLQICCEVYYSGFRVSIAIICTTEGYRNFVKKSNRYRAERDLLPHDERMYNIYFDMRKFAKQQTCRGGGAP